MAEFTDTETEKLIEVYKSHEVFWRASHPSYKLKSAKDDLWSEISEVEFNNKFTVLELKTKVRTLRTQYFREKKNLPTGSAGKKKKKPWKFIDQLSFLSDGGEIVETDTNLNINDTVYFNEDGDRDETLAEETGSQEDLGSPINLTPTTFKKKKIDKSEELLQAAIQSLKEEEIPDDKFDVFGRLVAKLLRELDEPSADKAQLDIQFLLYNVKYNK